MRHFCGMTCGWPLVVYRLPSTTLNIHMYNGRKATDVMYFRSELCRKEGKEGRGGGVWGEMSHGSSSKAYGSWGVGLGILCDVVFYFDTNRLDGVFSC